MRARALPAVASARAKSPPLSWAARSAAAASLMSLEKVRFSPALFPVLMACFLIMKK
jgi:hypothetical protein